MRPCYIFDIDGTLADNGHRQHHLRQSPKDWDAYHALAHLDPPHRHLCALANTLFTPETGVVFCTGRAEAQRHLTECWIMINCLIKTQHLYMRADGDFRPDHVVKLELLAKIRNDGLAPIMAFDDRNSVVAMWRAAGIPCAQVAEGDF
jgi:hypothetical protein